ncbi:hypothetical protein LGL55_24555 [Clostridium tagluense]|uniref:hypothetical protein n=1 Tax=Clostridium tagluense TaxID=360422 RepID=UPI001C0BF8ED|nr:hypothetical protein [Clostridium tagluense]MBU3130590.1 hypothetical protein [Clostridium tagluense]MCB2314203.1 hypothetical protein [Clostridium tagluense]MCB2319077.1 hypothetical protein [Clostridium tagluense]MCB2323945.1 hypothetical protein [Clostridium tagluense]MCB2328799.1 hypothetical protein [Clostridium tagluense]
MRKWNESDLKYKKTKIKKYLEEIEPKSDEERSWVGNQFLMIDELDSPEIDELLNTLNTVIIVKKSYLTSK